ncbi:MAG: DUF3578 domain-containing protein [Marinisporobacter sp.]|jgi:energy-coupling factor transporter ATP-binding protein EcfA2|nr:DUF3578 domain-containing protein [Marinisporobacter sp.]
MLKKNPSWTKIQGIENFIARKTVDLSIFNYGIHIPNDYSNDFLEMIQDQKIDPGKSQEITLEFDDQSFQVQLKNINRKGYGGNTFQIRYDSNKQLINYLTEKFKTSYQYIETHHDGDGKKNKVEVPEELAEYIEFYKTDEMFHYKVKLITKENKNMNQSLKEAFFNYIGPNDSLNNIQKSYKLMLLLQLLNLVNREGKADYDKVCEGICKVYLAKHTAGGLVETPDTEIQKKIDRLDKNFVKREMNKNPYNVIHKKGYIHLEKIKDIEYLCFDEVLWRELSEEDKENLRTILTDKLELYYRERVEREMGYSKLKTYFEKIMNGYLNARQYESFGRHELGELFRKIIPEYLKDLSFIQKDQYQITGSIGQGNWAKVPWLALMNKKSTTSTQRGIYIVYLFSEEMNKLYLTLMQGVTDIKNEHGKVKAKKLLIENAQSIRKEVDIQETEIINDIYVSNGNLGEMYQAGTIAAIEYDKGNIPDDTILIKDLEKMILYYERYLNKTEEKTEIDVNEVEESPMIIQENYTPKEYINHIHNYINAQGFTYSIDTIKNFYLSLKTKPFVLLAGISGTGKSKLVELFAEAIGATSENSRYTIIPVRPDWSDPSDLLGYKNIENKFQAGPLTNIIKKAVEDTSGQPYFVCLDEMNLARVEYYFSDILSLMETRKRRDGIKTDILLKDEIFGDDEKAKSDYSHLYIPENLYIIGTVNMDETTFPFSKKVLDRGNTIEFNHVNLSLGIDILEETEEVDPILMKNETLYSKYLKLKDCLENREMIIEIVAILEKINEILENVGLHFGYRVRDEIIFYMAYAVKEELMSFDEAMDYEILQKILPRIQGSNGRIKDVLIQLYKYLSGESNNEYDIYKDDNAKRMKNYLAANNVKYPLSSGKIAKMMRRYESDGFTTFWE